MSTNHDTKNLNLSLPDNKGPSTGRGNYAVQQMLKESFEMKKTGQNTPACSSYRNNNLTPSCAKRQSITGELSNRISTGQHFYDVVRH